MRKNKIAILGSTSHIAKGVIYSFLSHGAGILHLYARSAKKVHDFLSAIGDFSDQDYVIHEDFNDMPNFSYDAIINCVGVGTMNKPHSNYVDYFKVNEEFDNLAIRYLYDYGPRALYICFSSGAVYGRNFATPVEENSINCIRVNHIAKEDYYAIVRLNSEAKHRAFSELNIVDLRVFSYFSRFTDLADGYFITDIIDCILKDKTLNVDSKNIIRDYVHPLDLFAIIKKCISAGKVNAAFDVTSANPVTKQEILDYFSLKYGLKYKVIETLNHNSPTGAKNVYYSKYTNATSIGYKPKFSAMDAIKEEAKYIINQATNKIKRD